MKLLTTVLAVVYGAIATSAFSTTSSDDLLRYFELAFGNRVSSLHYAASAQYKRAVTFHEQTLRRTSADMQYLTCGSYSRTALMSRRLREEFRPENVQTIFVSQSEETTCYLVVTSFDRLSDTLMGSLASIVDVWSPLAAEVKVSPTLTSRVLAAESGLLPINLEVSFGLGGARSEGLLVPSSMDDLIASIEDMLRGDSAPSHVHNLASPFSVDHVAADTNAPTENIWTKASQEVSTVSGKSLYSQCRFDSLEYTGVGVSDMLVKYSATDTELSPSTCLSVVVAALVHTRGCFLVTEEMPNVAFNRHANSLLQYGTILQHRTTGSEPTAHVYHAVGLNGTDVIVGVADSGIMDSMCFFEDGGPTVTRSTIDNRITDFSKQKVIQYITSAGDDTDQIDGHGSHVVSTLAGSNSNDPNTNGVAPGAKIAFFDGNSGSGDGISIYSDFGYWIAEPTRAIGGTVHSNSWGYWASGFTYRGLDVNIDAYSYENADFLLVFAAGNFGTSGAIGSPGVSKNVLTVGSGGSGDGTSPDQVSYYSSIGPTYDGRFGIDVIAQGYNIYSASASTTNTCGSSYKSGTSMACPGVAGAAALVTEYFKSPSFWAAHCRSSYTRCSSAFQPSGTLVKAMLIHSGQDMGGGLAYPGNVQGFGRVVLTNVLYVPGVSKNFDLFVDDRQTVNEASSVTYLVTIINSTYPLKVTLTWMDPPSVETASKQLLHDLDLTVTQVSTGLTYYPNLKGVSGDHVNTVEMIEIRAPVAGETYSVTVTAGALSEASHQDFALVITSQGYVNPTTASSASPTLHTTNAPTPASSSYRQHRYLVSKTLTALGTSFLGGDYSWGTALPFTSTSQIFSLSLPMALPFFDGTYSTVYIKASGIITFASSGSSYCCNGLPLDDPVNGPFLSVVFWTGLNPDPSISVNGGVKIGCGGNFCVVVWENVVLTSHPSCSVTLEVVFTTSGDIDIYLVDNEIAALSECSDSSITDTVSFGIKSDVDGNMNVQYEQLEYVGKSGFPRSALYKLQMVDYPTSAPTVTPITPPTHSPTLHTTNAPTITWTAAPTIAPTPPPTETCQVPSPRLGDGRCHNGAANTAQCGWDSGDCCEATCLFNPDPTARARCGSKGYDCKDPESHLKTAAPTIAPTPPPTETCQVPSPRLGDGRCHNGAANTAQCGWDSGDCCEATCLANPDPTAGARCGSKGYDCKDPDATIIPREVYNLRGVRAYALENN